jgi:glyoxylase-like metal-dependent hydrolase (beta-lactamase superfamily II)
MRNQFYSFIKIGLGLTFLCCYSAAAENASPAESMADFCKNLPRVEYEKFERVSVEDDWFEVYKVAPRVTAIYEPAQWQEVISYLIEGDEKALLFDTGNGIADIAKLAGSLTEKPISVLNSHTHYDHVGGNYAFDTIYGMDTEFTRLRQTGHSNQEIAIEVSKPALCRPLPKGITPDNHTGRPFTVSHFISDGYEIDLGGRVLEVLHIPGHTPDAIALIDRQAKLMWTGDSYYSGPIWLFAPETDLDDYARSLDRLIKESVDVNALLPAHNTPWVNPEVLRRTRKALDIMINGETRAIPQGDGMVEHRIEGEREFSFLIRDEAIPYAK